MSGLDSSLTLHAALLVHPSGTIQPVVNRHEFTGLGSEKCCLSKQTWLSMALSLMYLDNDGVWLAINWIPVLPSLCQVLANPVTFDKQLNAQKESLKKYFWVHASSCKPTKKCVIKMKETNKKNNACIKLKCY